MKLLVVLGLLAFTSAAPWYDEIDWTKVHTRDIVLDNVEKGTFRRVSRIVGGNPSAQHQFPYQAGILISTAALTYFCGGALITEYHVLTAAHCLDDAEEVQVRLGAHNVMSLEITQQRFTTAVVYQHPAWNPDNLSHDFGIIELQNPALQNDAVQVARLPSWSDTDYNFAGYNATVVGWGSQTDDNPALSESLRHVDTTIMTNLACNIGFLGQILGSHICTSGEGGIGACAGDSGGCVIADGKLVGIVSFALSFSCQAGWPSGHARVTSALDWIYLVSGAEIDLE